MSCTWVKGGAQPLANLRTGKYLPSLADSHGAKHFKTCRDVILNNGDKCMLGSTVVAKVSQYPDQTFVGRVDEILTPLGSICELNRQADRVLLQVAYVSRTAGEYGMPYIDLQTQWALVPARVSFSNQADRLYN